MSGSYSSVLERGFPNSTALSSCPPTSIATPPVTSTFPFRSSTATGRSRATDIGATAVQVSILGEKISASDNGLPGWRPPTTRTVPSGSRTAWWLARACTSVPAGDQLLVAGSYSSAVPRPGPRPPTTSTLPSGISVAVCPCLGLAIGAADDHWFVLGSKSSALACVAVSDSRRPPTTRTRPSKRRVAVCSIRPIARGGSCDHPVPGEGDGLGEGVATAPLAAGDQVWPSKVHVSLRPWPPNITSSPRQSSKAIAGRRPLAQRAGGEHGGFRTFQV